MSAENMYDIISEISPDILEEAENHNFGKDYTPLKILAAAAGIMLLICGSIPVMAACNNETAYQIMYSVAPWLAQRLKPVSMSCENSGIVMEVVGMELDYDKANILISMKDTAENRLTKECDLFDGYTIFSSNAQCAGAGLVDYDEETGTAYFLISIDQMGKPIKEGDKIIFLVRDILPGKEHYDLGLDMIDLKDLPENVEVTLDYELRGGGGPGLESMSLGGMPVMVTDPSDEVTLAEGVTMTGYGIYDGFLHVQLKFSDIHKTDNNGYIYLIDPSGEKVIYDLSVSWFDDERVDSYEEYYLHLPEGGFEGYEIRGEFWTCNEGPIEGPWQVTIPLEMLED